MGERQSSALVLLKNSSRSGIINESLRKLRGLVICTSYSMHNHLGPAEYLVTAHFSLLGVDPRLTTHSCLLLPSWLQLCEKFRVNTSHLVWGWRELLFCFVRSSVWTPCCWAWGWRELLCCFAQSYVWTPCCLARGWRELLCCFAQSWVWTPCCLARGWRGLLCCFAWSWVQTHSILLQISLLHFLSWDIGSVSTLGGQIYDYIFFFPFLGPLIIPTQHGITFTHHSDTNLGSELVIFHCTISSPLSSLAWFLRFVHWKSGRLYGSIGGRWGRGTSLYPITHSTHPDHTPQWKQATLPWWVEGVELGSMTWVERCKPLSHYTHLIPRPQV